MKWPIEKWNLRRLEGSRTAIAVADGVCFPAQQRLVTQVTNGPPVTPDDASSLLQDAVNTYDLAKVREG
jgi:hypothetical protein